MIPQVAMSVQYFSQRTLAPGTKKRLEKPEPMGPFPALVSAVHDELTVNLIVFLPTGRHFVATDVTKRPTTPVQHYWREIPEVDHASDE